MKGKKYRMASSELLIKLKRSEEMPPPMSNSPQRPMFILIRKPRRVNQIPLLAG
jgi:hypothetical protein